MAINRDAYKSLVESVNEAVSAQSAGTSKGVSRARKGTSSTASSKPAAKKPTVSVADVQEALNIPAEAQLNEWPINIGGRTANNASELAQILNSMQNNKPSGSTPSVSKGVAGAAPRGNLLSNRRPGTTTTAKPAPKAPTVGVGGMGAMSEEWDILDEILAEGLELYGEEGLAEILAHFAETGEMSEELANLLGE